MTKYKIIRLFDDPKLRDYTVMSGSCRLLLRSKSGKDMNRTQLAAVTNCKSNVPDRTPLNVQATKVLMFSGIGTIVLTVVNSITTRTQFNNATRLKVSGTL